MMNPLKLFLITLGGASALAIAPYGISRFVSTQQVARDASRLASGTAVTALPAPANADADVEQIVDLPVPNAVPPVEVLSQKRTQLPAVAKVTDARPVARAEAAPARIAVSSSQELPKPPAAIAPPGAPEMIVAAATPTPALTPVPTPAPTPLPFRAEVAKAQELMQKLGEFSGKTDGKHGPITQGAIVAWRKKNNLGSSADVDDAMLGRLEEAVAALPAPEPAAELAAAEQKPEASAEEKSSTDEPAEVANADDPQFVIIRKESVAKTAPADIGPVPRMTRVAEVKQLQEKLAAANIYEDEVDGRWGHNTIVAMKEFQEKHGLEVTGKPNQETWKKMNEVATAPSDWTIEKPAIAAKKDAPAKGIVITDAAKGAKKADARTPITIQVMQEAAKADLASRPAKAEPVEKKTAPKAAVVAKADEKLEISRPESAPAPAVAEEQVPSLAGHIITPVAKVAGIQDTIARPATGEVVLKVNADAGLSEAAVLATPASISGNLTQAEVASAPTMPLAPKVVASAPGEVKLQVKAPKREVKPGAADNAKAVIQSDLPPAASKAAAVKLEKDLEEASTRIAMVSNDPRYELDKLAPQTVESVATIVDKARQNIASNSPDAEAARSSLKQVNADLEKAKQESLRLKAEKKVNAVEAVYRDVKKRFPEQIKKEPLIDLMAAVENGYSAMQADFKKGNYDPIVERCDGFKLQIEILANEAAKAYVDGALEKKSTRSKLGEDKVKAIQALCDKKEYLEAATLLDSSDTSKESAEKSSSAKSKRRS